MNFTVGSLLLRLYHDVYCLILFELRVVYAHTIMAEFLFHFPDCKRNLHVFVEFIYRLWPYCSPLNLYSPICTSRFFYEMTTSILEFVSLEDYLSASRHGLCMKYHLQIAGTFINNTLLRGGVQLISLHNKANKLHGSKVITEIWIKD